MYGSRMKQAIGFVGAGRFEGSMIDKGAGPYDPESRWYALWTRSRQEKVASAMLDTLGVQHYLPLKSELRQWSDRKQIVDVPVFNGYLFIHFNLLKESPLRILNSRGVVSFVGNQSGPLPIPDQEIEDIRTVLSAKVEYSICPSLNKGDRVRVIRGALAGVEGTLAAGTSGSRLVVSIESIQQSLALRVSREDVELVCSSRLLNDHLEQAVAAY